MLVAYYQSISSVILEARFGSKERLEASINIDEKRLKIDSIKFIYKNRPIGYITNFIIIILNYNNIITIYNYYNLINLSLLVLVAYLIRVILSWERIVDVLVNK